MGIQYVTVKVDTSGLFQPLSSATGVVGVIGAAPSAGAGFSNPTLFTRPLTGAPGEPYSRVAPVLKVAPLASDIQTLSVAGAPTGGAFTLSFSGQATPAIAFNATAAAVQAALNSAPALGGTIACSGGPLPAAPVTISFQGARAFRAQPLIAVAANNLTGGAAPVPKVEHTVAGAAQINEVQSLSFAGVPSGGSFTLSLNGRLTGDIAYNAPAADVQAALTTLVGDNNIACSGGPLPTVPVAIAFQNALGGTLQSLIAAGPSKLPGPAATVAESTHGAPGVDEIQMLSVTGGPTGGNFTLSFGAQTSATPIAFNADAAGVQAGLEAIAALKNNVTCSGGPLPGASVAISFKGGLAAAAQSLIALGANNLTGGATPAPALARARAGASPTNESQSLAVGGSPNGGTFTLSFASAATAPLPYNATAGQIATALQALPSIAGNNVACGGGPLPASPVVVTFQNALGGQPQPLIQVSGNSLTANVTPAAVVTRTTAGVGVTTLVTPVDVDNNVIPNIAWDPLRYVLVDATTNAPLSVDVANKKLRYSNGSAFQHNGEDATIALDGFSIVAPGLASPAPFWGAPLDASGQPAPNLLMRPDVAPANAFVDFARNTLSIDGALGAADKGTGKPKGVAGNIYYTVTFDICPLAKSINVALVNGALQVLAYRLDPPASPAAFDASAAYADFVNRDINIVCLSFDSNPDHITALKNHVELSSPNDAGGGGIRPRIGVAMLPSGGITDSNGNLTNKFSDWKTAEQSANNLASPMNWASSRMVFVAANSPDDAASAAAGVIAGLDPWVSLILKPVGGIGVNGPLTDGAIQIYIAPNQSNLQQPHVIPIVHPDFLAGSGPVMGEGFSADGAGQRLYVDIVRTIDDIAFRLKATLTSPQVIGTLRINRPGLRVLRSIVRATLKARVDVGEIDDFAVDIPIQALTEKDPAQLTPDEQKQLQQVQNSRQLAFNISVTYSGAIHQLVVNLKFL